VERREDVGGEDVGVDADNVVDRSTVIGDEAVDTAVDETTFLDVNGSGSRRMPSASTQEWMLPNVISNPPCRPEKAERGESVCGVHSKDPKRMDFPILSDEGADDGVSDAGGVVVDTIGAADEVPCTSRFPTDVAT
jgi:hypothetical protein